MTGEIDPSARPLPADDVVIVFRTETSGVRGRLARLGSSVDTILAKHHMPDGASAALAEVFALAAVIGSALPKIGRIILQTQTDGAVPTLVAHYDAPGKLRGYARFEAERLLSLDDASKRLGDGHLAITIDALDGGERYQAILAVDNGVALSQTAADYFEQRENLPTFVRVAVAQNAINPRDGTGVHRHWRAGALMMQPSSRTGSDDDWPRVRTLAETLEDHELLDPDLSPERLLLRLFHEEGVRIERVIPLVAECQCSSERVEGVLRSFDPAELIEMRDDDGRVTVTCEFCTQRYAFDPKDFDRT
jgi:molecular chaperone Hsp33